MSPSTHDEDPPPTAEPRAVTVTGHGSAATEPDLLVLDIGVEATRSGVREAYAAAGSAAEGVRDALAGAAVPDAAVRTAALQVRAEIQWQDGGTSRVTGYTVSTTMTVRLPYPGAEATVAAVVEAGGNDLRLGALTPSCTDPGTAVAVAREAAWADARRAGAQYAALAGRTLGAVLSIHEKAASDPQPWQLMARTSSTGSSIPLAPGEATVTAAVTVTWELA